VLPLRVRLVRLERPDPRRELRFLRGQVVQPVRDRLGLVLQLLLLALHPRELGAGLLVGVPRGRDPLHRRGTGRRRCLQRPVRFRHRLRERRDALPLVAQVGLERRDLPRDRLQPLRVQLDLPAGLLDRTLRHLPTLACPLDRVLRLTDRVLRRPQRRRRLAVAELDRLHRCFLRRVLVLRRVPLRLQLLELAGHRLEPRADLVVLIERDREPERRALVVELAEPPRLRRLPPHDPEPALGVLELLARADQVRLRPVELPLALDPALLELRDPRRFLEDRPPLHRAREQHRVDLALLDDRVRVRADPRVQEQIADVLQTRPLAVDQVLARPVAEQLALHRHLVGVHRQRARDPTPVREQRLRGLVRDRRPQRARVACRFVRVIPRLRGRPVTVRGRAVSVRGRAVSGHGFSGRLGDLAGFDRGAVGTLGVLEDERDTRHPRGLPGRRAREDDIDHLLAAQALARPLAEHPLDRVHDIALAAAVRAHDAGDRLIDREGRLVRERFEPVQVQTRQPQALGRDARRPAGRERNRPAVGAARRPVVGRRQGL
jgi:hypothetical protein